MIAAIIPLRPGLDALAALEATRRAHLRAWQEWIATNPDPDTIAAELRGTTSALAQLWELGR